MVRHCYTGVKYGARLFLRNHPDLNFRIMSRSNSKRSRNLFIYFITYGTPSKQVGVSVFFFCKVSTLLSYKLCLLDKLVWTIVLIFFFAFTLLFLLNDVIYHLEREFYQLDSCRLTISHILFPPVLFYTIGIVRNEHIQRENKRNGNRWLLSLYTVIIFGTEH